MQETLRNSAKYVQLVVSHRNDPAGRNFPRVRKDSGLLPKHIRRVVCVIPGFLGTRSVTRPLEIRFDHAGVPAFSFNLGLISTLPMRVILWFFKRRIDIVRRLYPYLERVDLVGHSMGGIIALEAIECGIFAGLDTCLVGLGSPFRGTNAAYLGWFIPGAAEMFPVHPRYWSNRPFHRVLDIPFLSLAGQYDILAPPERCRHLCATFRSLPVDHAGLIFRKSVFEEVFAFLDR